MRLTRLIRTALSVMLLVTLAGCGAGSTTMKPKTSTASGPGSVKAGTITLFTKGLGPGGYPESIVEGPWHSLVR